MKEEEFKIAYYLRGWKLFIWKLFIDKVYPALKEGHKEHLRLIREGYIGHQIGNECPICKNNKHF
jgi:hypothetical protein